MKKNSKTERTIEDLYTLMNNFANETKDGFSGVKVEFSKVRSEMKAGFSGVSAEFSKVRSEMKAGFSELRSEMYEGFAEIKTDMDAGFSSIHSDLEWVKKELKDIRAHLDKIEKRTQEDTDVQIQDFIDLKRRVAFLENTLKIREKVAQ